MKGVEGKISWKVTKIFVLRWWNLNEMKEMKQILVFVAAYLIYSDTCRKICIYNIPISTKKLQVTKGFGWRSSHLAKRSVPNGATELLPWLAFLSGRCLVKGFFAASI